VLGFLSRKVEAKHRDRESEGKNFPWSVPIRQVPIERTLMEKERRMELGERK